MGLLPNSLDLTALELSRKIRFFSIWETEVFCLQCCVFSYNRCHNQGFYMPPYAITFSVLFSCSKQCRLSFSGETCKNNILYLTTKQIKQQTWLFITTTTINQHFIVIHITSYFSELLQNYRYFILVSQKSSFFFNNISSIVRKVLISIFQSRKGSFIFQLMIIKQCCLPVSS